MVRAYVLVKVEAGKISDIVAQIRKLGSVERADAVTGPSDLILSVTSDDPRALAELIFREVQAIPGVRETDTRIVVDS